MAKLIRVGFIGLNSSSAKTMSGQWATNAHLPYLTKSSEYTITALCNSSMESAKKVIERHGLDPAKVHAYGDPESLANDPDVDLVVCSVNVAQHYTLCKPALLSGKMVFCEWPLASNMEQMKELANLASERHVKTMVGLQGRNGPYIQAIKNKIGDGPGQIGQILSTSVTVQTHLGLALPQDVAYLAKKEVGGNILTISAIHLLDTLTSGLGEIKAFHSVVKNKRTTFALLDSNMKVIDPAHPITSPDHVFVHGELEGDIPFDFQLRGGPPFKNTPSLDWRIYAMKGEIRISSMGGNLSTEKGVKFQVYHFDTEEVEDIELDKVFDENDPGLGFQPPADNVARLYSAFAKGETDKYLNFQQSLKWAEFIDKLYE
ncbi:uncharacterized protein Z518_00894 [Rhinocladiella mackenziei CBS 650.93]|uniref:Gfo/Idh/MocA-like oxidoreductase N-terminal domain-containing protein n=1 Tax=Rhinocladiella mackenziei CBS 650.93 TaxID=1442369 RepID=A0A0D2HGK6_9EURO|nr:uncharacterized protein Z518_00894 [Rhinocladiella mackenziei CBS 650.93]KIX09813.1 hypothetical protein Z518_00894 [Rhinocladiella mackenziei CBS 650.93]